MQITFLGTGTSHGVPIIGCNCSTCTSKNPKNRRYRSSLYIKKQGEGILIDTPPELRLQLLENNIEEVSSILFTHAHADHLMGFDDIRGLNRLQEQPLPCYGKENTLKEIKTSFHYIFDAEQIGGGIPRVELNPINSSFEIGSFPVTPLPIKHGKLDILGFRIDDMAYLTDCSKVPAPTREKLEGIKTLIIDALRYRTHPTHMNVEQALELIERLNVNRAYLTHISHNLEHEQLNEELPAPVYPAYDGLQIVE